MNNAKTSVLNKQLPAYLGFFVLLITLVVTIVLSGNTIGFVSRATVGSEPKNIQTSNISDTAFTISYTTDVPAVGTISYGTDSSTPSIAQDDRTQQASGSAEYQIHFITVKNLSPSTKYYYAIDSGSQKANNNGSPFEITTAAPNQNPPTSGQIATGSVALSDGSIPTEGIIYLTTANAGQLATLISPDGSYQLPLDQLRSAAASPAAALTPDTLLQLQVVTQTAQSTAKVLLSQASQIPKIILPQNYDFTLAPALTAGTSDQTASSSGFPVLATPAPVSSPEITTPTDTQAFKDQQPQFSGRALANTEVDILIQSQQEISVKLQSDTSGSWQFRPPVTLEPGKHTITIKSLDTSGILQTISRSFTVYAAGSKFVEPSVSPVAKPTSMPSPTAAATPTTAPTATPAPTAVLTATPQQPTVVPSKAPIPKTGSSAVITGLLTGIFALSIGAFLFFAL